MASDRIQPFCRKHKTNISYYDGFGVRPRNITERNVALKIHKHHFCLIWQLNGISFIQAKENELKPNAKVVDSVISDELVKSFFN